MNIDSIFEIGPFLMLFGVIAFLKGYSLYTDKEVNEYIEYFLLKSSSGGVNKDDLSRLRYIKFVRLIKKLAQYSIVIGFLLTFVLLVGKEIFLAISAVFHPPI